MGVFLMSHSDRDADRRELTEALQRIVKAWNEPGPALAEAINDASWLIRAQASSPIMKTTVTFTVLHRSDDPILCGEEFIGEQNGPTDGLLGYLLEEAWNGGMVGLESDPDTVPVPRNRVAAELLSMGNDGHFFDDDLKGGNND